MADTLLVVDQITEMDLGVSVPLKVQTNAIDYDVTLDPVDYLVHDKRKETLTSIAEGLTKITVTAEAVGFDPKSVEWYCLVKVIPTELTVDNQPTEIYLGESIDLGITTNAGSYEIIPSDPSVISVDNTTGIITAISMGSVSIKVTATKYGSVEEVVEWNLVCNSVRPVDDGEPTILTLVNSVNGNKMQIATSRNLETEHLNIKLPTVSGELVVKSQLEDEVFTIEKPLILSPLPGAKNYEASITSSQYVVYGSYDGLHEYSLWQASSDRDFSNIMEEIKGYGKGRYECNFSLIGDYFIRVKYVSGEYVSPWSDPLEINLGRIDIEGANLTTPLHTSPDNNVTYYGEVGLKDIIGIPKCIQDIENWGTDWVTIKEKTIEAVKNASPGDKQVRFREYIGPIEERKRVFNPELYTVPADAPKRFVMLKNTQCTYNGKLYYAKIDLTPQTSDEIKTPDEAPDYWEEDTRPNLCSATELLMKLRFATWNQNEVTETLPWVSGPNKTKMAAQDNNTDGKSINMSRYWIPSSSELISNADYATKSYEGGFDINYTYFKYMYKGKLCYTFKRPPVQDICWNDLAKLELVYGERTIRIGTNLYRVRLMHEDEYLGLFRDIIVGQSVYTDKKLLYIHDKNDTDWLTEPVQWLYDTREGNVRKAVKEFTIVDIDPKFRRSPANTPADTPIETCGPRLVLEYIPENAAPYNNMETHFPNRPNITNELKYDPYTDTGYFGVTSNIDLVTYGKLCNIVGMTAGTLQHEGNGFLNFYWHGMLTYIAKKSIRYNVTPRQLMDQSVMWGYDMGGSGKKTITINNIVYRAAIPSNIRYTPYESLAWLGLSNSNHTKIFVNDVVNEIGKYSQFQELMTRVTLGYAGWEEVYKQTDNDPIWSEGYMGEVQSAQRGENWDKFHSKDLGFGYTVSGNGTGTWCRGVGVNLGTRSGTRGPGHVFSGYNLDYSTNAGYRPCLSTFSTVMCGVK